MTAPIIARCTGCGTLYDARTWVRLPYGGVYPLGDLACELRHCTCRPDGQRFTISAVRDADGHYLPEGALERMP